jgi:hypothetical protein
VPQRAQDNVRWHFDRASGVSHLQIKAAPQTASSSLHPPGAALQKVLETVELVPGKLTKEIVEYGAGEAMPARGQTVTAHYDGRLTNGVQFDASRKRGKPFNFRVGIGQVISGWDVGMASMVRRRSTDRRHARFSSAPCGAIAGAPTRDGVVAGVCCVCLPCFHARVSRCLPLWRPAEEGREGHPHLRARLRVRVSCQLPALHSWVSVGAVMQRHPNGISCVHR